MTHGRVLVIQPHTERGLTLTEVLDVVAVLIVIVAIAVLAYIGQVNQARHTWPGLATLRPSWPPIRRKR